MESPIALVRLIGVWVLMLTLLFSVWFGQIGGSVADRYAVRAAGTIAAVLQADPLAVRDRTLHGACPHVPADPAAWNVSAGTTGSVEQLAFSAASTADDVVAGAIRDNLRYLPRIDDAVTGRAGFVRVTSEGCKVFVGVDVIPMGAKFTLFSATRTACMDFAQWPAVRCGAGSVL